MIQFHLDEHVAHAVATALRNRGIDVTTTTDAGLVSASDEQQLHYARESARVIVTHDADFLRLNHQELPHAGIVFAVKSRETGELVRALCLIYDVLSAEDLAGRVEFI